MSNFISNSSLNSSVATFDEMLKQFGVVTVMNARVFLDPLYGEDAEGNPSGIMEARDLKEFKAHDILAKLLQVNRDRYVAIDTLKIANINMEGPTKTVTGGQYVNPLIKFGKTATIEMQDALGRADVIEALGGGIVETYESGVSEGATKVLHLGQDFAGAKTILGESFFIDRKTGSQVKVYVLLYEVLPDSIMNLTQDAEGDATVFDLNGTLSSVDILIGVQGSAGDGQDHKGGLVKGVFYSVLPQNIIPADKYNISFVAAAENPASAAELAMLNANYGVSLYKGSDWVAPTITGLVFNPDHVDDIAASQEITVAQA